MSTSAARSETDAASTIPTFSYAQAAKRNTPPTMPSVSNGDPPPDQRKYRPKRPVSSDRSATPGVQEKGSVKRTASEGRMPENTDALDKIDVQRTSSYEKKEGGPIITSESPTKAPDAKLTSLPSSPEYGTTSTPTLVQEEDISSTGNASSESTWDKQSQSSQTGGKSQNKVDIDDQANINSSSNWDEDITAAPTLKEAPAPATNIWQQ